MVGNSTYNYLKSKPLTFKQFYNRETGWGFVGTERAERFAYLVYLAKQKMKLLKKAKVYLENHQLEFEKNQKESPNFVELKKIEKWLSV